MNKYFGVKCYFSCDAMRNEAGEIGYEERIVLLKADNEDQALSIAEDEAKTYADKHKSKYLGFADAFSMLDVKIEFSGVVEVYSITMFDDPDEDEFLDNYYLTGGNSRED